MVINRKALETKHNFTYSDSIVFSEDLHETTIQRWIKRTRVPHHVVELGKKYLETYCFDPNGYLVKNITPEVGFGLFSNQDISKNTFIGEYAGELLKPCHYLSSTDYQYKYPLEFESDRFLSIDAKYFGNHTRFINHSYSPNLDKYYAFFEGLYHVIFQANRDIKKGEQLTFNYGKNYWYIRGTPTNF